MTLVLIMLTAQGLLGAFDNIWHHEITQKLPSRPSARTELALHTVREFLYVPIFISIAWARWQGAWAVVFCLILAAEIVVTLWDFVVEDQTRSLPRLERITHTILAINFGAILAVWIPEMRSWAAMPTGFAPARYGAWSWVMTIFGIGVFGWAIRDLSAVARLAVPHWKRRPIRAGAATGRSVLIIGATGFVGRALTRALVERGERVMVLARDPIKASDLFGPHVLVHGSLDEFAASRDIDAIVNLAGEPLVGGLWTPARRRKFIDSRAGLTDQVVAWIGRLDRKPKVLLNASAVGYYGDRGEEELTEASAPRRIFLSELCQRWEHAAQTAESWGIRVCCLRFGFVLGTSGGALPALTLSTRFGLGSVIGSGDQWVSWIDIDDLVRLILFALERPDVTGPLNATAPFPATYREFVTTLATALGRRVRLRIPAWLLRAGLGELSTLFLASQRASAAEIIARGFRFVFPTLEEAFRAQFADDTSADANGPVAVMFNNTCPVCCSEMAHYEACAIQADAKIAFRPILDNPDILKAYGLSDVDLRRRLYVVDAAGTAHSGIDAFIRIWRELPQYRWAVQFVRMPGMRDLCEAMYEGAVVPILAAWNRRREARSAVRKAPLYPWLLGDSYRRLPAPIRSMHDIAGIVTASGIGTVAHGDTMLSRLLCRLLRFPAAGPDQPLTVTVEPRNCAEVLSRRYPDATLVTEQVPAGAAGSGLLGERFGPMLLILQLTADSEGLTFTLRDAHLLGLALPRRLRPRVTAHESADGGWVRFFVRIHLPLVGPLIQYEGSLKVELGHGG